MSKFLFLITLITWLGLNDRDHTFSSDDLATFLTGTGSKSWYLYATTPESAKPTCKAVHPISLDNSYTFSSNGTFEFDHGAITDDTACESDCCSDLINLTGTWEFTNGQKQIKIIALHEHGNPANAQTIVLYDATIDQLDENVLKFIQTDPATHIQYSFEFRRK